MAGRLRRHGGGIAGLLGSLDEHGEAIEFDLIGLGLRLSDLGTERLTWRDLLVVVRQAPATSALYRSIHPEESQWQLPEQLFAAVLDALNVANWQRSGGKRKDYPELIPRPGVGPTKTTYGGRDDALPRDEFDAWLAGQLAA